MKQLLKWILIAACLLFIIVVGYWAISGALGRSGAMPTPAKISRLRSWFNDTASHPDWALPVGERCGTGLMLMPTSGYLGFAWDDSFRPGHRHSGLDIFGPDDTNNVTPIVAAYDGYLTRENDWKSTVVLRHPDFPLSEVDPSLVDQTIWTYYTHMASQDGTESYVDAAFPPGTFEQFVEAGTLLGRQGNWSGNSLSPTGRHLHFSIVKSNSDGGYLDEREIENTFEPAQFLGLRQSESGIWGCPPTESLD